VSEFHAVKFRFYEESVGIRKGDEKEAFVCFFILKAQISKS
jgi:hypothetical protein